MSHRLRGRRLLAVLPVTLSLALGLGISDAKAWTNDNVTASSTTGNSSTISAYKTNATLVGQFEESNFLGSVLLQPNGSPCQSQQADARDLVCAHLKLTVVTAGAVHACIAAMPSAEDFGLTNLDLFVLTPPPDITSTTGQIIGSASSSNANACVDFNATAGQVFELQVNPETVIVPTEFALTVKLTPAYIVRSNSCFKGRHMEGHSKDEHDGHHREYHGKFEDDDQGGRHDHDKYTYRDSDKNYTFRATQFDAVNVKPTGLDLLGNKLGVTHVEGYGVNNSGQTVPFVLDIVDGGSDNAADTYSFSTGDGYSSTGKPSTGKNKYYEDGESW